MLTKRSFGLLLLMAGCADVPGGIGGVARPAPVLTHSEAVPGVSADTRELRVVRRGFGEGYLSFELNRAVDPSLIDVSRARLMTIRPNAQGELETVEAAGDAYLDETGRILSIGLADQPKEGEVYRAFAGDLDLGDVVIREADGVLDGATLHLPPKLLGIPSPVSAAAISFSSSKPYNGEIDVARDLIQITITYSGTPINCGNPITGKAGFFLYSVDPALPANKQQQMWPNMPVGWGPTPQLVCDGPRNEISMTLPGQLLGGSLFKLETNARATDGSTLPLVTTFRTRNPGLQVKLTKATNEIYKCDTHWPTSNSYRCDIYLITQVKTRGDQVAWQTNNKIPSSGDWSNWAEDTSKVLSGASTVYLYQDAQPVGDPVAVEIHAYDADTGDGAKKAVAAIGGLGTAGSVFYPPLGPIGLGLSIVAAALPVDDDDFQGGGSYMLPKSAHWGAYTNNGKQTYKLPGRPAGSQIVVEFWVNEYPASWFPPAPIL